MARRADSYADIAAKEDELWRRSRDCIRFSRGWSLRRLALLSRPGDTRRVWLAEGEPGTVIVKASANPFVAARAAWARDALAVLAARGHLVPAMLWHGLLDDGWSLLVLERLPGRPLRNMDRPSLNALVALVEVQADAAFPGGWDVSEWIDLVLFEGWEHWWTGAEAAAPETSRRLRAFVEPARGYRLPPADLVHGDFNVTNVLAAEGAITGVVDWDALGCGSCAVDLAGLLFDWHRLRLRRRDRRDRRRRAPRAPDPRTRTGGWSSLRGDVRRRLPGSRSARNAASAGPSIFGLVAVRSAAGDRLSGLARRG